MKRAKVRVLAEVRAGLTVPGVELTVREQCSVLSVEEGGLVVAEVRAGSKHVIGSKVL